MGSPTKPVRASKIKSTIVGKVRYHRHFQSEYVRPRDIIVWLPPSYMKNQSNKYPVLYMQDGQNLFDPATAFAGVDWQVDETLTRLIQDHAVQEVIVVGIYNSPDRLQEYSASTIGLNYAKFMTEELKPFID